MRGAMMGTVGAGAWMERRSGEPRRDGLDERAAAEVAAATAVGSAGDGEGSAGLVGGGAPTAVTAPMGVAGRRRLARSCCMAFSKVDSAASGPTGRAT